MPVVLLRTGAVTTVVGLLAVFAFICLYSRPTRPLPPVLLKASVSSPGVCFRESGFDVKVLVRNQADHTARDVEVSIYGRSMSHLTCQYVDPPEAYFEGPARAACALVGDLEPGDIGSVLFHFAAARAGELDLTAHVTAANLEGVQKLPIEGEVVP